MSSSSLVPDNDPTLLFTNAGMVQFKDIFTGKQAPCDTRAVTAQKCLRAGGKHNDLENVGHTERHHTFFEMLGNFSFGDYFKEEAIAYAWEFITKQLELPKDRLHITVYSEDDEAYSIWQKLSKSSIIKIPTKDNFWAMGDKGPCGPCSEIFYDHGSHLPGGLPGTPDQDGPRFVEIWNLVFMQFEDTDKGRIALPKPSIDTGMGLERIASVMQGTHDNYETDLFKTLIQASTSLIGKKDPRHAHRIIADHIRASAFLIADGVFPSNEGRGYVLRRIIRRALRHIYQLGHKQPVFYKLVDPLVGLMGAAYPELVASKSLIENSLHAEEESFLKTLSKGIAILGKELVDSKDQQFSGKTAFALSDTYGFPVDLTQSILRDYNQTIDMAAYDACLEDQKKRSRKSWEGSGDEAVEKIWFDIYTPTEFVGYAHSQTQGIVDALVVGNEKMDFVEADQHVFLIANQTPFYGESGGQLGDHGFIKVGEHARMHVQDTKKHGKMIIHKGVVLEGRIKVGDTIDMHIDEKRRKRLRKAHSATHILHAVLTQVLGKHVMQKGSLVDENRLRFDFSHPTSLSKNDIKDIESRVNHYISEAYPVKTDILTAEEAKSRGAIALFNEKYEDWVRVVSMGDKALFSQEFCGGTHVSNTGEIGLFYILSDSSIASGIRRIEAITGSRIIDRIYDLKQNVVTSEEGFTAKLKDTQKKIASLEEKLFAIDEKFFEEVGEIKVYTKHQDGIDPKAMRNAMNMALKNLSSAIVVLSCTFEDKASCVIGVTSDLTGAYDARLLAQKASVILGGTGGGGQVHLAQAGGPNIAAIKDLSKQILLTK